MIGVVLPGDGSALVTEYELPEPGPGQVLVRVGASGICGSDIGYIYNGYKTHKGLNGEPAYRGVIAGHEPCGRIVSTGAGVRRFRESQDVIVYHIHGCGMCRNCRAGYFVSCADSARREAYGWQRDGGHAEFILADESECIPLPTPLTYVDGALIACGFGTAYEGLRRTGIRGGEDLVVVGLGPVGLAAAMIGRLLGARRVFGVERSGERIAFVADLKLLDEIIPAGDDAADEIIRRTGGRGADVTVDASGGPAGRAAAVAAAAEWGRVALLGEGGDLVTEVSDNLLHKHLTITASWVTSLQGMEDLANLLMMSGAHPEVIVSHRFALPDADEAYRVAADGATGKVVLVPGDHTRVER